MDNKKIGAYLKSLREEQEISLEEVSKITKIKVRFLEDIEHNRFDSLGGVGYSKAMIHSYGKFLKADLKFLVELLNRRFSEGVLPELEETPMMTKKILFSLTTIPIVIIIIFAIVFGIVIIKNYNSKKHQSPLSSQKMIESTTQPQKKKAANTKKQVIDSSALQDTTNYLNKYMFKKKNNPFKSDQ